MVLASASECLEAATHQENENKRKGKMAWRASFMNRV